MRVLKGLLSGVFTAGALFIGNYDDAFANRADTEVVNKIDGISQNETEYIRHILIEWEQEDTRFVYNLYLDQKALTEMEAKDFPNTTKRYDIVKALRGRGGVSHDFAGVPSVRWLDLKTGRIIALWHYKEGRLQDPDLNTPAVQRFDRNTGLRTHYAHYTQGELQNPFPGEPAVKSFDSSSGKLVKREFYQSGGLMDPENGVPASVEYNPNTGEIISAIRRQEGTLPRRLELKEIKSLNENYKTPQYKPDLR